MVRRTGWTLLMAVFAFLCLGQSDCKPTTVTLSEPPPSTLDLKVTVLDYDATPADGKLAVFAKFTSNAKPAYLQGDVLVTCNGHALPFDQFWQSYADRVPLQPVGGAYHFRYTLKGQAYGLDATVPARPVITSPKAGPPNQGAMVVIRKDLSIGYLPDGGAGVDVGAGDGSTGLGSPGLRPDNGLYEGFNVTALKPGPGTLGVTRRFEYAKSGTAFKSATVNYSSSADLEVTWLLPIDQMLARCPTAAEIAAINQDFTFTYDIDPTAGTLVCTAAAGSADLTRLQERTYQALLAMKRIQFDAALPWSNKSLYTWFAGAVKGIRYRADIGNSSCCEPANVINVRMPPDAVSSFCGLLTDRWIKGPDIRCGLRDLVVLLAHEARHNEGKPHTCNRPDDLTNSTCNASNFCSDQTLAEMGAWGVQYNLLKWFADHADQHFLAPPGPDPQLYRTATEEAAASILSGRFCTSQ